MEATPELLYREAIENCVYEEYTEALNQSTESVARELREFLSFENDDGEIKPYTESGEVLLENKKEVIRLMKKLTKAMNGDFIEVYKRVK